eukprot:1139454-Pelagomonas_calceolata.AAC.10
MAAAPLPKPPPPPPLLGSTEVPFIPTASPQPPLGRTAALDEKHAADPAPSSATWGPPGAGAAAVHDVVVVVVVLLLQLSVPVAPGARVGCRDCRNACSTGRPAPRPLAVLPLTVKVRNGGVVSAEVGGLMPVLAAPVAAGPAAVAAAAVATTHAGACACGRGGGGGRDWLQRAHAAHWMCYHAAAAAAAAAADNDPAPGTDAAAAAADGGGDPAPGTGAAAAADDGGGGGTSQQEGDAALAGPPDAAGGAPETGAGDGMSMAAAGRQDEGAAAASAAPAAEQHEGVADAARHVSLASPVENEPSLLCCWRPALLFGMPPAWPPPHCPPWGQEKPHLVLHPLPLPLLLRLLLLLLGQQHQLHHQGHQGNCRNLLHLHHHLEHTSALNPGHPCPLLCVPCEAGALLRPILRMPVRPLGAREAAGRVGLWPAGRGCPARCPPAGLRPPCQPAQGTCARACVCVCECELRGSCKTKTINQDH